ncbi:C6 zinc cluster transcription factor-like protein [Paramarasmius palmivorus]|uniref:C6 zinc cluster transcription factor-like protein n=1 Tax=Paramarasmius palmivorus TaxID=297713 RepID=A0AAW0E4D1_9AGAR
MIDTIYIARHGFRLNWVTTAWTSPTDTPRDPPLAAFGETQAQELATYFLSLPEDERPTGIWSSPFYRCIQTAVPVSKALNVPIYVEHGIGEWYSPVAPNTGLHPRPGSASFLKTYFDDIDPSWESIYYPSRKGETVIDLYERCRGFLDDFLSIEEVQKKHKKVLFFSHAATVIALSRELKGDREMPLRVGVRSLTQFQRNPDGGWNDLKLADASYLTGGVQRDWGLEDIVVDPATGEVVEDTGVDGTQGEKDEPVGSQKKQRNIHIHL